MRSIFCLFLLLVSCAKLEQENPILLLAGKEISEISAVETLPLDTLQGRILEEVKRPAEKIEEKFGPTKEPAAPQVAPPPQESSRRPNRPQRPTNPPQEEPALPSFVFDDKFIPRTREEARVFAFECYKKARAMLNRNIDSSRIVAQKGLSVYENASLYYLAARGLFAAGNFPLAVNYCKTALSRSDFWGNERNETLRLLVESLQKRYERTPSSVIAAEIEKYKEMLQ